MPVVKVMIPIQNISLFYMQVSVEQGPSCSQQCIIFASRLPRARPDHHISYFVPRWDDFTDAQHFGLATMLVMGLDLQVDRVVGWSLFELPACQSFKASIYLMSNSPTNYPYFTNQSSVPSDRDHTTCISTHLVNSSISQPRPRSSNRRHGQDYADEPQVHRRHHIEDDASGRLHRPPPGRQLGAV